MDQEIRAYVDGEPIYYPNQPEEDVRWLKATSQPREVEITSDQIHNQEEPITNYQPNIPGGYDNE